MVVGGRLEGMEENQPLNVVLEKLRDNGNRVVERV